MILLTVTEIIAIHSKLIKQSGGLDGIRDIGLLESAVASANNSFYDVEQYVTMEEKASRLGIASGVYKYDDIYPMCRKIPCFSYGDIRHFHRIYASN